MTVSVDLSIIIVNWNTRELLQGCLHSVYGAAGDLTIEVFVVDNASVDGSAAMVRERFPRAHMIENRDNVGFAAANNQGLALAQGRYMLLLNSDAEVKPGALSALLQFMDSHPEAGASGPCLLNTDGSLQLSCFPILTPWREFWRLAFLDRLVPLATYPVARWRRDIPRQVGFLLGACLLLRQEALQQVGILDERYFMYTEEMDLCYRLARAKWRVYWVPQAEVLHYGGASSRQAAQAMYVQLYRSKLQFHRKMGGQGRAWLFKVLLVAAYVPRLISAAVASLWSPEWAERARTYRQLLSELPGM